MLSHWAAFGKATHGETTPLRSDSRLAAYRFATWSNDRSAADLTGVLLPVGGGSTLLLGQLPTTTARSACHLAHDRLLERPLLPDQARLQRVWYHRPSMA